MLCLLGPYGDFFLDVHFGNLVFLFERLDFRFGNHFQYVEFIVRIHFENRRGGGLHLRGGRRLTEWSLPRPLVPWAANGR